MKIKKQELHNLYLELDYITVSQNTQDDNGQGACQTCDIKETKFWLENLKVTRKTSETQALMEEKY